MPGIYVWYWLRSTTPGGGPQGGLFAFLALFALLAGLTLVGLATVIRLVGTDPAVSRPVLIVLLWLVLWSLVAWKMGSWANTAPLADATPDERTRARLGYVLLLLLSGFANLGLLARLRGLSLQWAHGIGGWTRRSHLSVCRSNATSSPAFRSPSKTAGPTSPPPTWWPGSVRRSN